MPQICKKCQSRKHVKNGIIRKQQRYRCKDCGYNYTLRDNRGKLSEEAKNLILLLYGSGKMSYGMLGRLFKVSRQAILYRIRTLSKTIPTPEIPKVIESIEFDEMWHFLGKKKENLDMESTRPKK